MKKNTFSMGWEVNILLLNYWKFVKETLKLVCYSSILIQL